VELPLISICVPTYNGEKFIEEAMISAMNQTYPNFEIIISDDNSKDKTLEIIKKFENFSKIPITIYNHQPNGIGANWNNCVQLAKGTFIKFLFQDDLLERNCLEELIKPFLNNENLGLSFCRRKILMEHETPSNLEWIKSFKELHIYWTKIQAEQKGKDLLKDRNLLLQPRNKVGEPTAVLLKKEVFKNVGYFRKDLKQSLDYEFWYRVFKKYDIGFIEMELISFRLHAKQATVVNATSMITDYELFPILLYKNFFWYLNPILQKDLFFKYNRIGIGLKKILNKCLRFTQ